MQRSWLERMKIRLMFWTRVGWRNKGLWLRALLCWLIGLSFVAADQEHDYDVRLQIRGTQSADPSIVIVLISYAEWTNWIGERTDSLSVIKEPSYLTDNFYWQPAAWEHLISLVLQQKPRAIGVSPYFGENVAPLPEDVRRSKILTHPKVVWSTQIDDNGRILASRMAKTYSRNSGLNEYAADRDGIVRRFGYTTEQVPHLATQLARRTFSSRLQETFESRGESLPVINYRGVPGTFPQIHLQDLLNGNFPPGFFKNKTVLIGTTDMGGIEYRTPLGIMPRVEVLANLIDNLRNDRWIQRLNLGVISLLLLLFVLVSAWITSY